MRPMSKLAALLLGAALGSAGVAQAQMTLLQPPPELSKLLLHEDHLELSGDLTDPIQRMVRLQGRRATVGMFWSGTTAIGIAEERVGQGELRPVTRHATCAEVTHTGEYPNEVFMPIATASEWSGSSGFLAQPARPGTLSAACPTDPVPVIESFFAQAFQDLFNVPTSTTLTSNQIRLSGFTDPLTASVPVGAGHLRVFRAGAFITGWVTEAEVLPNDVLQVRQVSPASYSTRKTLSVSIGGWNGSWSVTTASTLCGDEMRSSFQTVGSLSGTVTITGWPVMPGDRVGFRMPTYPFCTNGGTGPIPVEIGGFIGHHAYGPIGSQTPNTQVSNLGWVVNGVDQPSRSLMVNPGSVLEASILTPNQRSFVVNPYIWMNGIDDVWRNNRQPVVTYDRQNIIQNFRYPVAPPAPILYWWQVGGINLGGAYVSIFPTTVYSDCFEVPMPTVATRSSSFVYDTRHGANFIRSLNSGGAGPDLWPMPPVAPILGIQRFDGSWPTTAVTATLVTCTGTADLAMITPNSFEYTVTPGASYRVKVVVPWSAQSISFFGAGTTKFYNIKPRLFPASLHNDLTGNAVAHEFGTYTIEVPPGRL